MGDIENVAGVTGNVNVVIPTGLGSISMTLLFSEERGFSGATLGFGPSRTKFGGSLTASSTGIATLRGALKNFQRLFSSDQSAADSCGL